uniref:Uncharacterized protein n=1 Tax=Anguilla anguilla TaxID=7936 RepID=A0A0E9W990_ANGAN
MIFTDLFIEVKIYTVCFLCSMVWTISKLKNVTCQTLNCRFCGSQW